MTINLHYLADQPHHVYELAELHAAEWGHLFPRISVATRPQHLQAAAGRSEIPTLLITLDGPTLVGSAALVEQDMPDRPELTPHGTPVAVMAKQLLAERAES